MRDYGKISTSIWRSQKFRNLNGSHKLFYLYLHSCPHVNSVGCFWMPNGYAAADLNWKEPFLIEAIESLSKGGLIIHDADECIVYINGFLDHSPVTNSKHAFGSAKVALSLPDCDLKELVLNDLLCGPFGEDVKTKINAMPAINRRKFSSNERRAVHEKTDGKCHYCGVDVALFALDVTDKTPYMTIDHMTPICLGGDNHINNLTSSCQSCNSKKGVEAYRKPIDTTEPETEPDPETDPETDKHGIDIPGKVDEIGLAVSLFNELASEVGLAQVQKLTPSRKTKLTSRMKDAGGIEGWKIVLDMVRGSDFLTGKKSEWKADFDFLVTASKFVKVMEGSYANVKPTNPSGGGQGAEIRAELERLAKIETEKDQGR